MHGNYYNLLASLWKSKVSDLKTSTDFGICQKKYL